MNRYVAERFDRDVIFIAFFRDEVSDEFADTLKYYMIDACKKRLDGDDFKIAQDYLDTAEEIHCRQESVSFSSILLTADIANHLKLNGTTSDEMHHLLFPDAQEWEIYNA